MLCVRSRWRHGHHHRLVRDGEGATIGLVGDPGHTAQGAVNSVIASQTSSVIVFRM